MADEVQEERNDQQQAQAEAEKKVNVPDSVKVGQTLGYDPNKYTQKTKNHADLLKRFGVPTYAAFENQLGNPFARSVVAYLLGDADHARVLGTTLVQHEQSEAPGGTKGEFQGDADDTYKAGGQEVSVKDGAYFVGGHRFVEKRFADLYAARLDNPVEETEQSEVAPIPADGNEKTALGADAEVGDSSSEKQALKEKQDYGVAETAEKQADAAYN